MGSELTNWDQMGSDDQMMGSDPTSTQNSYGINSCVFVTYMGLELVWDQNTQVLKTCIWRQNSQNNASHAGSELMGSTDAGSELTSAQNTYGLDSNVF